MKKFLSVFLLLCAAFSVESWATDVPTPNPNAVFFYGTAVPGCQNGGNAPTALLPVGDSEGVYVFKGELKAGDFYFSIPTADLKMSDRTIYAPEGGSSLTTEGISSQTFEYPATTTNRWSVSQEGFYVLTLDIKNKTFNAQYKGTKFSDLGFDEDIYMWGPAFAGQSNGWDLSYSQKMEKRGNGIYRYVGKLTAGLQFRFLTSSSTWAAVSFRPAKDQTVNAYKIYIEPEVSFRQYKDVNWVVSTDENNGGTGVYCITLDVNKLQVTSEKITPNPGVYVMGTGLPDDKEWDLVDPISLEKITDREYAYRGHLDAGAQIKFQLKKGENKDDWSGPKWIKANNGNDAITNTDDNKTTNFAYNPTDDNPFKVSDAGYYELILDLDEYTISSTYLGASIGDMFKKVEHDVYIFGNASNGWGYTDAVKLNKLSATKYQYKGKLNGSSGDSKPQFKFFTYLDYFGLLIRPYKTDQSIIVNSTGITDTGIGYYQAPDKCWFVNDAGYYTINLNLEDQTIDAIDYMAELPTSATAVTDNGTYEYYATFSNIYSDMELSVKTGTIEVYNVKVNGDKLDLIKREGTKVACGEGVLVKASTPTITVTPVSGEALTPAAYGDETLLVATPVSAKTVTADGDYLLYRLTFSDANNQTGLGFYYGSDDGSSLSFSTPQPNKAYLKVPSTTAAQIKGFSLNPHPTHVEGINAEEQSVNEPIYDLSGRRVENPTKGFYLQGNKKIIVK